MGERPKKILILWNQTEEDIYEQWRSEGPQRKPWNPDEFIPDVGTVAEELDQLVQSVEACGLSVTCVNIKDDLSRLLTAIQEHAPDCVFNLVEYFGAGEPQEHNIAGLYELLGVPYTGSPPLALALCQNKRNAKVILQAAGIPTPAYLLVKWEEATPEHHALRFPLMVKPVQEDASGGISALSVVPDQAALEARVTWVHDELGMDALVEEYIEGREIHAAIVGNEDPEVLPLFEMEFDDSEFNPEGEWRPQIISFEAKWDPHTPDFYSMDAVVPAENLDESIAQEIRHLALRAYEELGCRDYARVDMRLDENGQPYILEVNPNPDLADGAAFMMCAAASGRSYQETLGEILGLGLSRAIEMEQERTEAAAEAEAARLAKLASSEAAPPAQPPGHSTNASARPLSANGPPDSADPAIEPTSPGEPD